MISKATENRFQQLFSTMNSENVLQRDHLPRKSNERVRPY
ncbi:hypothetical protein T03_7806 [Trichinella britovi]|uniref:Uncharacterized protein n=1 Tax=Trichinella britovi TaxID=45882 RepID=A0A0V1C3I8_TRIBR|nr:hypothetical protein T03_7806 [Trichinella britovi]